MGAVRVGLPSGGGPCESAWGRRRARPAPGTVGPVAEAVAAPPVAGAWRWGVLVLAAVVVLFALVTDPGTPAEILVAVGAVLPFVLWSWRRAVMPTLALVVLVSGAQFGAQR